jgi:hypothetical protein
LDDEFKAVHTIFFLPLFMIKNILKRAVSSVVECLPNMCKVLFSIPAPHTTCTPKISLIKLLNLKIR